MRILAWVQLRRRARRFGRLRQHALIDWWLGEIQAVSGPEPRQ